LRFAIGDYMPFPHHRETDKTPQWALIWGHHTPNGTFASYSEGGSHAIISYDFVGRQPAGFCTDTVGGLLLPFRGD
jgi:hypothetical protein